MLTLLAIILLPAPIWLWAWWLAATHRRDQAGVMAGLGVFMVLLFAAGNFLI